MNRGASFPTFYKAKALIAINLKDYLATYPEPRETFSEFSRRMRLTTGFGFEAIKKILEEDYPQFTVKDDMVVSRE